MTTLLDAKEVVLTAAEDAVATELAIKDHVVRAAEAVKKAGDPQTAKRVAKWKAAAISDLKSKGTERCFG